MFYLWIVYRLFPQVPTTGLPCLATLLVRKGALLTTTECSMETSLAGADEYGARDGFGAAQCVHDGANDDHDVTGIVTTETALT